MFPSFFLNNAFQIVLILVCIEAADANTPKDHLQRRDVKNGNENVFSHSCIHDQIIEQRRKPGRNVYSITPQLYQESVLTDPIRYKGRALLSVSKFSNLQNDAKQPIRIFLNYDAVGHSPDRDCRSVGDIVKVSAFYKFA